MKRAAFAWLIIVGCAAAWLGIQLHRGVTDLTALLVQEKRDPAIQQAEDLATGRLAQRVFVMAGDQDRATAHAAGAAIAGGLAQSGLTLNVTYRLPADSLTASGAMYFPYRFGLLTSGERELLQNIKGTR